MRILYCTTLRLPSERAYGKQIAAVAGALVALGHQVTILAPTRKNPITDDFWSYHHVDRSVALEYLPAFDGIASPFTPGVLGLWAHQWSFLRSIRRRLVSVDADLLYTRNPVLLSVLLATGLPVACELHTLPRLFRRAFVRRCNRCAVVACLTTAMRNALLAWGVDARRLYVAPDAVDPEAFADLPTKDAPRRRLGIPPEAFVVGYAGSISTMALSKGVELIVDAVGLLKKEGVMALIAGGPAADVERLRSCAEAAGVTDAVRLLGHVGFQGVRDVYAASDVLIYPAPATKHPYFLRDTSPLKLLEYMASGKPIACADLPPVHDVLDAESAALWIPGDALSLVQALKRLRGDPAAAAGMAHRASKRVRTWKERMQGILFAVQ